MVDPFAKKATGTPFQEPVVDGHSSHETPIQEQPRVEVHSAHETTVLEASPDMERPGWETWPDRTELPDWTEGPCSSGAGMAGMSLRIVRAMCRWTGPPCTSVVVHVSRSCRLPASRGR